MAVRELSMTQARNQLTTLPERLAVEPDTVAVTRRGRPVLAVMPWELYESLVETLEVLGDGELMEGLRRGLAEAEAGETLAWDEAKAQLEL